MTSRATHPGQSGPTSAAPSVGCLPDGAEAVPGVGTDGDSTSPTVPGIASLSPVRAAREDEPLFGLDDGSGHKCGPLETAVRRTLSALDREGALTEADAGRVALAVEMSQIIADKRSTRRTSTVGHDARVLMDILDELAPAAASESDKMLRRAMDDWTAMLAAQAGEARTTDGRTEVRD